jgi:hypothetical protein
MRIVDIVREGLIRAVVVLAVAALATVCVAAPTTPADRIWVDGRTYVHYITTKHKLG